jgi:hypothetical protein
MDPKGKVLQGSRIQLRPLARSDVGAIARWHDDREIMTMISLTRTGVVPGQGDGPDNERLKARATGTPETGRPAGNKFR